MSSTASRVPARCVTIFSVRPSGEIACSMASLMCSASHSYIVAVSRRLDASKEVAQVGESGVRADVKDRLHAFLNRIERQVRRLPVPAGLRRRLERAEIDAEVLELVGQRRRAHVDANPEKLRGMAALPRSRSSWASASCGPRRRPRARP